MSIVIGGIVAWGSWDKTPVWVVTFIVSFIILLLMLDNLGIIELRKSVDRHTKCVICGRTDKPEDEDHDGKIKETKIEEIEGELKETKTLTHEHENAIPLEGIVISNRVVCTDCIKKIRGITWQHG